MVGKRRRRSSSRLTRSGEINAMSTSSKRGACSRQRASRSERLFICAYATSYNRPARCLEASRPSPNSGGARLGLVATSTGTRTSTTGRGMSRNAG
ncbi:hypothetical protein D9M68_889610 [compost metagenome]